MIEARRAQLSFGDGLIAEEVTDLWDDWMRPADQILDDDQLLSTVYEALAKRRPKSRTRGRRGTPAEVVLRLLLLKHIRNWSYEVVEREVRANLVYRSFTRVGGGKVPDDTVMNKWALAPGARGDREPPQKEWSPLPSRRRSWRAQDARRYDRRGNQHPLSDRQQPAGRWGARSHARDEADRRHRRGSGRQTAGPQSEREVSDSGDWTGRAQQGWRRQREVTAGVREITGVRLTSSGTGEALRTGDRSGSQEILGCLPASSPSKACAKSWTQWRRE